MFHENLFFQDFGISVRAGRRQGPPRQGSGEGAEEGHGQRQEGAEIAMPALLVCHEPGFFQSAITVPKQARPLGMQAP